jgi:hypothetical protein
MIPASCEIVRASRSNAAATPFENFYIWAKSRPQAVSLAKLEEVLIGPNWQSLKVLEFY